MNLILEIIDAPAVDIFQKTMRFDMRGGKIGRSKTAKWTLNDPTKHMSNFHAEVTFKDGQYFLTDISSNGMFLKTPYKKFVKGVPMPLTQKSAVMIGDYVIGVKTIESDFSTPTTHNPSSETPPSAGIPDTFFVGDLEKEAFGVIESSAPEENDIVSLLGNETHNVTHPNEMLLPELDNIMGTYDDEADIMLNDSLSTHIEPPTFEENRVVPPAEVATPINTDESVITKILSLKFGIDLTCMSDKEKESFVSEIADLTLNTLEHVRNTYKALEKIQKQLGVSTANQTQGLNPLKTAPSNKEIFVNLPNYSPSISHHVKNLFHEFDTHTIAFYTAYKNLSIRTAEKFSPEKLYFHFEKKNALNKSFTNKKALAWEAYCKQFKYLDHADTDTLDLSDLQKEYTHVLETLNLGYNT